MIVPESHSLKSLTQTTNLFLLQWIWWRTHTIILNRLRFNHWTVFQRTWLQFWHISQSWYRLRSSTGCSLITRDQFFLFIACIHVLDRRTLLLPSEGNLGDIIDERRAIEVLNLHGGEFLIDQNELHGEVTLYRAKI